MPQFHTPEPGYTPDGGLVISVLSTDLGPDGNYVLYSQLAVAPGWRLRVDDQGAVTTERIDLPPGTTV